jgi:DnaK suppressor protein
MEMSAVKAKQPVKVPTEAELLRMPAKDYMNEVQLAFFRNMLQSLREELMTNAGETSEHLRETPSVPDPADRATIEEEHALELRTRDRERKLMKKIEQSLARIESGDYGYCDETGEPIGLKRLLARPTATLSIEAQHRRELKQKMYGE